MNVSAGLIGWWCPSISYVSGDVKTSRLSDLSINRSHGTIINTDLATFWEQDNNKIGVYACHFDGIDDYVSFGNVSRLKPGYPVTIAAWANFDTVSNVRTIFANDDYQANYGIALRTSLATPGALIIQGGNGTAIKAFVSSSTVTTGRWYHLVGVCDSASEMSLYVDGSLAPGAYSGTGGTLAYTSASAGLGRGPVSGVQMDGSIDDVRLFNRRLSLDEIAFLATRRGALPLTSRLQATARHIVPSTVTGNRRRRFLIASS